MTILLADIGQLLNETMGLDATSIGSLSIERALQERQAACGCDDPHAYWELVSSAPAELQALIEAVVVRETWFFREKEAFNALVNFAQQEWLPRYPGRLLRVLSLPCASGEEPYSIAMALLDGGIPADRFCIDAVDICRRALEDAQRAVYGKNSFRSSELDFRDRHFTVTAHGYHVTDRVRQQVRFHHGNIFAADFLPGTENYDMIFCRNVLIYFDRTMQNRAISVLDRLLAKPGCLFVGSSETGLLASHGFASAKMPLASAFRKTRVAPVDQQRPASAVVVAPPKAAAHAMRRHTASPLTAAPAAASAPTLIEQAERLADQGRLDEARTLCEQHMKTHGPSAQAFHLLGLIYDARGDRRQAGDYYRKVLYLHPQHPDALIHLASLLERQGDDIGAGLLRARLDRVKAKRERT
jgi:chemotaxis protein methyltransferase WspC